MSEGELLESTLMTAASEGERPRARVACLTVLCHPDPSRIGERALLTPLMIRSSARISRAEPLFAHPGDPPGRALLDPYLSRDPIEISVEPAGSLCIDRLPEKGRIDGAPVGPRCVVERSALERGVVLQLSSRVLLLLHVTTAQPPTAIEGLLGHSDAIEQVRRQLLRAASLGAPVLIRGENGVGKESAARAVHTHSPRAAGPFVSINMGTLSDSTAAAVLFGHARGAFTGAAARHHGLFERAHRGTLFLDEVGDTPALVQPMLLRALETGLILPLGDEQEKPVDVRFVAATEQDLESDASAFRTALLHRLAGYTIGLPSLRERPDDIPRLFVHFLRAELAALDLEPLLDGKLDDPAPPLRSSMIAALVQQRFPGNVRELINLARQVAIAAADTGVLELPASEQSPSETLASSPTATSDDASRQGPPPDAETLLAALERNAFSPMRTATELGVPASTVHFWMKRRGIRRARDLEQHEIAHAEAICHGDLTAMAKQLRVSARALRLVLGQRDPSGGPQDRDAEG